MLPRTSEGQNGAVAVRGSVYMVARPSIQPRRANNSSAPSSADEHSLSGPIHGAPSFMSPGTARAVGACAPGRAAISSKQTFPAVGLSGRSVRMTRRDSRSRCPVCLQPALPRTATTAPRSCRRRCPRSRRPASAAHAAIDDARLQTVEAQAHGRCEGLRNLLPMPGWCRGDHTSAARARCLLHRAALPAWVESHP